jgi:hypothetical protein
MRRLAVPALTLLALTAWGAASRGDAPPPADRGDTGATGATPEAPITDPADGGDAGGAVVPPAGDTGIVEGDPNTPVDPCPTWFHDADGDGVGGPDGFASCAEPAGYVSAGGDCDDGDPAIHPGAFDPSGDCFDQDCDSSTGGEVIVPEHFPTIQAAVNAIPSGGAVCVLPGEYPGSVLTNKSVTVYARDGLGSVLLDASGAATLFRTTGSPTLSLYGLTLTGSTRHAVDASNQTTLNVISTDIRDLHADGGPCSGFAISAPTNRPVVITDVRIVDNTCTNTTTDASGGLVYIWAAPLTMTRTTISQNHFSAPNMARTRGGVLFIGPGSASLDDVTIHDNSFDGYANYFGAAVRVEYANVVMNHIRITGTAATLGTGVMGWQQGGGLSCVDSSLNVTNFIIAGNHFLAATMVPHGAGVFLDRCPAGLINGVVHGNTMPFGFPKSRGTGIHREGTGMLELRNVAITANTTHGNMPWGAGVYSQNDTTMLNAAYNLVSGNTGSQFTDQNGSRDAYWLGYAGNISAKPMYVNRSGNDPAAWDFHPQSTSPLINRGTKWMRDVDGSRADIGAFGGLGGAW